METLCCDKTGTLTQNRMRLTEAMPAFLDGVSGDDLLTAAALATKWWEPPADALDALVLRGVDTASLGDYEQVEFFPFDSVTKRTESTLRRKDGSMFKVSKGAPRALLQMAHNYRTIRDVVEQQIEELAERGVRCLGVACTNNDIGGWVFMGVLTFTDPLRADCKARCGPVRPSLLSHLHAPAVAHLPSCLSNISRRACRLRPPVSLPVQEVLDRVQRLGIRVKIFTGDDRAVAADLCRSLGLQGQVLGPDALPDLTAEQLAEHNTLGVEYGPLLGSAVAFAQVLPVQKVVLVETLRQQGQVVGMTARAGMAARSVCSSQALPRRLRRDKLSHLTNPTRRNSPSAGRRRERRPSAAARGRGPGGPRRDGGGAELSRHCARAARAQHRRARRAGALPRSPLPAGG